jgi:hypothetical protein
VVGAGNSEASDVSVSLMTPLTGPGGAIPEENVVIYREEYVDVSRRSDSEGATGRWPDALIPARDPIYGEARDAFPVDVPAGENRVAWIDVLVPADQMAGTYSGALEVMAAGGFSQIVPVTLEVRDFTLPSTSTLRSAFGMDWEVCTPHFGDDCFEHREDGWALKSLYVRAALENRVTVDNSDYMTPRGAHAEAKYARYILPLVQGQSPQDPEGEWSPVRLPGAELTSVRVTAGKDLNAWKEQAREGGFGDRAFLYACDEPNRDADIWKRCLRNAREPRERGWKRLRILITSNIRAARSFGAADLIDLIVPIVNELDDKPGASFSGNQRASYNGFLQDQDNELWTYSSCESHGCGNAPTPQPYWIGWPSYAIDQPASEHRAMGFLAFEYDVAGELYWSTTYSLRHAFADQYDFGGNGEGNLFYAGTPARIGGEHDIPLDSIRLKRIRDGREDFEYLHIVDAQGQGAEAVALARELFPRMFLTDVSATSFESTRTSLADLIDDEP